MLQTGKAAQRFGLLLQEIATCVQGIGELQNSLWQLRFWSKLWKKSWFCRKIVK